MKPGDRVLIDEWVATVCCDVDAGEYSADYTASEWADVLKTGILVMTEEAGLIHFPDARDARLISGGEATEL